MCVFKSLAAHTPNDNFQLMVIVAKVHTAERT